MSEDSKPAPVPTEVIKNKRKAITVAILGARSVRDSSWMPSEKCYLCCSANVPGKDYKAQTTRQVKDLPHPSWREEFSIKDYEEGDTLEFTLWECLEGSNREVLGKAYLEAARFDKAGFCGDLRLELAEAPEEEGVASLKVMIKCESDGYPAEPPQEFAIALTNTTRSTLGIDFDLQDGKSVFVRDLRAGIVDSYNGTATSNNAIQPGDFIVKVNQAEGNAVQMLEALKSNIRLELVVRRPIDFVVAIAIPDFDFEDSKGRKKKGGACTCGPQADSNAPKNKYGVDFKNPTGMNLVVMKVLEGGPVEDWNNRYPEAEVRPGDRVTAVNGEKGQAEDMLRIIQASDRFQMRIVRPAADKAPVEPVSSKRCSWSDENEVQEYQVDEAP